VLIDAFSKKEQKSGIYCTVRRPWVTIDKEFRFV
jgi:hypothetical protein